MLAIAFGQRRSGRRSAAVERRAERPRLAAVALPAAYRAVVVTALPAGSMNQLFSVTDSTFRRE
jgi:hypothetical protein